MTVIDDYLAGVPAGQRKLLEELRKEMHKLLPGCEEAISYNLPCFKVDGEVIGGFAATKSGASYYPFSGSTLLVLKKEFEEYSQTKGALHFSVEQPLSKRQIKLLVDTKKQQIAEANATKVARKKTK